MIGALVGGIGAGVFWLASMLWPPTVAVILSLVATVFVTGALHEDALADAADGFGGGSTPERILEIMKDSRIGSYGAVALILAMALKISLLASLTRHDVVVALIAGNTLARWSSVLLLGRYDYVGTKGAAFAGSVTTVRLVLATVLALGICALALQRRAFIPVLVAVAVTTTAGVYFRRRLGGVTGDCLGAANQIVELSVYLVLCAA